jgi:hypothetical protein
MDINGAAGDGKRAFSLANPQTENGHVEIYNNRTNADAKHRTFIIRRPISTFPRVYTQSQSPDDYHDANYLPHEQRKPGGYPWAFCI